MIDPNNEDMFRRAAYGWWRRLQPDLPTSDRGALSRLRRADLDGAALEPRVVELCHIVRRYCAESIEEAHRTAALIAGVLARVRDSAGGSVAWQAKEAEYSENRFRQLLTTETHEERLSAFRRLVDYLDREANIGDLALSLANWDQRTRERWTRAFY